MKLRLPTTFTIIFLAVLATVVHSQGADEATAPAKKYAINLSPAWKVGQKFAYVADASIKGNSLAFNPADSSSVRIALPIDIESHIEGTGEVLAVKDGALTKMSLTVTSMNASSGGRAVDNKPIGKLQRPIQILDAGANIVVERDEAGRETFMVDGKPLVGEIIGKMTIPSMTVGANGRPNYHAAAYYLRMLIDLDDFPGTDQVMYGPKEAVAPGDGWPAGANALNKAFEPFNEFYQYIDPPMAPDPQHRPLEFPTTPIMMKFENVSTSGNHQVATVSGHFAFNGMALPPQPASVKTPNLSLDLQGDLKFDFPINLENGVLTKASVLSVKRYRSPVQPAGAPSDEMNLTIEFKLTQKYTFQ